MLKRKKTKIIATLGPSTETSKIIEEMIIEGVDVFRINFSHSNYYEAEKKISLIRKLSQKHKINISILADLQGPKLRIGKIKENSKVTKDDIVTFLSEKAFLGDSKKAYINYQNFAKDVSVGEKVLLDDGKLIFEIIETDNKCRVKAKAIQGGSLSSNKGVNLPNTKISLPALTKKDKEDAIFAIEKKVDWIALSFVRSADDLIKLRKILKRNKSKIGVISKIEKPEAVKNIDEIITHSNAIMVARGDLGVEVPPYRVPAIQKKIVKKAVERSRPVIIATQMLESMTFTPVATRAEVNDVANSVIDGADAVMLSGETSVGKHPIKTVETMRKIIRDIEKSDYNFKPTPNPGLDLWLPKERQMSNSICQHASQLSEQTKASAIICMTYSGYNAIKMSSLRPVSFIYVFTNNYSILNKLSLVWGVQAYYYDREATTDQTITETKEILRDNKLCLLYTSPSPRD